MTLFTRLRDTFVIVIVVTIFALFYRVEVKLNRFESSLKLAEGTVSLQMYESIEHWSDSFNIPKHVAYNVAYKETGYRGPFHFNYEHELKSSAGAVGPMQIITKWAQQYTNKRVKEKELRENVDLNVRISMQMLRKWYNTHGDWTDACGAYNSGRPIHNDYAIYCSSNTDYKEKWVDLK